MPKRCPDDIDPKAADVLQKRRLRLRDRPEPPDHLQAGKAQALARAKARPLTPGILFEPDDDGGYTVTPPHTDEDLWELQIADAFGTRSMSVIRAFVGDLKRLCSQSWDAPNDRWKPNETELNAALAMVADVRPANTAEAALAAQMVAIHMMQMRLSAQALNNGGMVMERDAALAGKLARTYAMLVQALQAMRGKKTTARQSIKVTKVLRQEVHYHDHRGDGESVGQPHGSATAQPAQCAALPSPESSGEIVRLPSRARPRGV